MVEHAIGDAYYQFEDRFLDCSCGFVARGWSWEDVGYEMDRHLSAGEEEDDDD